MQKSKNRVGMEIAVLTLLVLLGLALASVAASHDIVGDIVYNFPDDGSNVAALLPAIQSLEQLPSSSVVLMDAGIYDSAHPDRSVSQFPGWDYFFEYTQVFSNHKVVALTNSTNDIRNNVSAYSTIIVVLTQLPSTSHYPWLAPTLQRLGITVSPTGIISPYNYQRFYSDEITEIEIPEAAFLAALGS